jgi:hypothetical protein
VRPRQRLVTLLAILAALALLAFVAAQRSLSKASTGPFVDDTLKQRLQIIPDPLSGTELPPPPAKPTPNPKWTVSMSTGVPFELTSVGIPPTPTP